MTRRPGQLLEASCIAFELPSHLRQCAHGMMRETAQASLKNRTSRLPQGHEEAAMPLLWRNEGQPRTTRMMASPVLSLGVYFDMPIAHQAGTGPTASQPWLCASEALPSTYGSSAQPFHRI